MGRGRQKAKHTKVARDLKYFSPDTNYGALAQELSGAPAGDPRLEEDLAAWPEFAGAASASDDASDETDLYVDKYAADFDDDDDIERDKSA